MPGSGGIADQTRGLVWGFLGLLQALAGNPAALAGERTRKKGIATVDAVPSMLRV